MLVPIALLLLTLIAVIAIGLVTAKRRIVDNESPPDVRPDDPPPSPDVPAHVRAEDLRPSVHSDLSLR